MGVDELYISIPQKELNNSNELRKFILRHEPTLSSKELKHAMNLALREKRIRNSMNINTPVSPLYIDKQYNFTLPLYPLIEIDLTPLQKAIYILMLRHPEGIILKEIGNYSDEIMTIYNQTSNRQNNTVTKRILEKILNPANNLLHKTMSLIRTAFTSKLRIDLALNYIPNKGRRMAHSINMRTQIVKGTYYMWKSPILNT